MFASRALAAVLAVGLGAAPGAAFERIMIPAGGTTLVTPAADLQPSAHARVARYRAGDRDWHWRYRAAYSRWLHNEYVHAGYPVRHRQLRTYVRVVPCCCCGRWDW